MMFWGGGHFYAHQRKGKGKNIKDRRIHDKESTEWEKNHIQQTLRNPLMFHEDILHMLQIIYKIARTYKHFL